MKRRSGFSDYIKKLPSLKKVEEETHLPYVFDLFWDAKLGKDLEILRDTSQEKKVFQYLAQNGFDAKEWQDRKG
jgi:hypothetical protein